MAQVDQFEHAAAPPTGDGNRRLTDCYQRGLNLARGEKNHDYAHAMFAECVLHDPGNLRFVESMVQNLRAAAPKRVSSRFKLRRGGSRTLRAAMHRHDWAAVLHTGIDLLRANPWDVTTLRAMAEACAALHHNEVELVYLKQALDAEPKNVDVNRHCARSLGRMGQFDQAIACWHRVEKLRGTDEEAAHSIAVLAEDKLKRPANSAALHRDKSVTTSRPEEPTEVTPREIVLSPRQKLEQAIAQYPLDATNYLELADMLSSSNQFNAAERVLTNALAVCGEHRTLSERLERVRFLRAEDERQLADEQASQIQTDCGPSRIPWLELALVAATIFLAVQLFPPAQVVARNITDVRQWSRFGWIVFTIVLLCGLVAVRLWADFRNVFQRRKSRRKRSIANTK
jgi:tetratricopeptide (TPR) repeat protein